MPNPVEALMQTMMKGAPAGPAQVAPPVSRPQQSMDASMLVQELLAQIEGAGGVATPEQGKALKGARSRRAQFARRPPAEREGVPGMGGNRSESRRFKQRTKSPEDMEASAFDIVRGSPGGPAKGSRRPKLKNMRRGGGGGEEDSEMRRFRQRAGDMDMSRSNGYVSDWMPGMATQEGEDPGAFGATVEDELGYAVDSGYITPEEAATYEQRVREGAPPGRRAGYTDEDLPNFEEDFWNSSRGDYAGRMADERNARLGNPNGLQPTKPFKGAVEGRRVKPEESRFKTNTADVSYDPTTAELEEVSDQINGPDFPQDPKSMFEYIAHENEFVPDPSADYGYEEWPDFDYIAESVRQEGRKAGFTDDEIEAGILEAMNVLGWDGKPDNKDPRGTTARKAQQSRTGNADIDNEDTYDYE